MDSVGLYDSSINAQLVHYEQTVSDLQNELDDLFWRNLPQSIISELGHLADYVLSLLREAEVEYRFQRFAKAQQTLNSLSMALNYLRQLLWMGKQLSSLKINLEQLLENGLSKYRPLVGYHRILLRKFSVVIGMVRMRQETVGRQLEELCQGLEELEECLGNQTAKGNREIIRVPRVSAILVNKKIIAAQAG